MSDDLLKALGAAGREERGEADKLAADAPALDDIARERMVNAAFETLGAPKEQAKPAPEPKVKRPSTTRIALFAAVAVAAAIALFFGFRGEALPGYELAVQGGASEWRGETPGVKSHVTVRADGTIELLLRPREPVDRPVEARAFATRAGAEKSLPVEVSAQGVARVIGRADRIFSAPAPGTEETWDVVIVVGDRGRVPTSVAEARASRDVRRSELSVVITN